MITIFRGQEIEKRSIAVGKRSASSAFSWCRSLQTTVISTPGGITQTVSAVIGMPCPACDRHPMERSLHGACTERLIRCAVDSLLEIEQASYCHAGISSDAPTNNQPVGSVKSRHRVLMPADWSCSCAGGTSPTTSGGLIRMRPAQIANEEWRPLARAYLPCTGISPTSTSASRVPVAESLLRRRRRFHADQAQPAARKR